jgi:hypothetical protein
MSEEQRPPARPKQRRNLAVPVGILLVIVGLLLGVALLEAPILPESMIE